jgi:hypothetical protein
LYNIWNLGYATDLLVDNLDTTALSARDLELFITLDFIAHRMTRLRGLLDRGSAITVANAAFHLKAQFGLEIPS